MKENNLFEISYAIFLIMGCIPSYMYGFDIFFTYHYWYLAFHLTLLYCLFQKNQDTWWILFSLALGMPLADHFIEDRISYSCMTTFNLIQWLCDYYGDASNEHLKLFSSIRIVGYCIQYTLLLWVILKRTRLKYGI